MAALIMMVCVYLLWNLAGDVKRGNPSAIAFAVILCTIIWILLPALGNPSQCQIIETC